MALETAQYIHQLDPANPSGPDRLAQGDDHLRLIKQALKATFPNINGPVTATDEQLAAAAVTGLAVPIGTISLWYGASAAIPAGYALCDGRTVNRSDSAGTITTPDMRGRVPVGADATNATGAKFGQNSRVVTSGLGGAHTHTGATAAGGEHSHSLNIAGTALTISQLPPHTHSETNVVDGGGGAPGGSGGKVVTNQTSSVGSGEAHTHTGNANSGGNHTHALAMDAAPEHSHSVTVDVTQASIALHYIMKV